MSHIHEESTPAGESPVAETADKEAKPATAKKATAKKTAKKAAAKKTAARKTAKKAAKKAIAPESGIESPAPPASSLPPAPPPAPEAVVPEAPPPPPPAAEAAPPVAAEAPDDAGANRRIGRVPGGGPVAPRADEPTQAQAGPPADGSPPQAGGESKSRKRREKRKRKRDKQRMQQPHPPQGGPPAHAHRGQGNGRTPAVEAEPAQNEAPPAQLSGPKIETDGLLELAPKGFGFLRVASKNFEQARDDVFVPPDVMRRNNLRPAQWIHGLCQDGPRGRQLVEVLQVNGSPPEEAAKAPYFDELKAVNPNKRISFETTPDRYTTRVVDIMTPVGRGQRGLIVSPPRSGKTTLLLHMAEAIREKYDETIHLMVLLVDERPEEVTEFRRALPGAEIYASSNDELARNHCRIAELAIERAKRLVEGGAHVFLLMDSITRLARAYNNAMARGAGRNRATGSGGIMIGALEVPRRLFAAARNTREAGSLTIIATALIQTNSRADEAIFMEFKGTGNMELVLDRRIAENYIYPAVDIFRSGTRREELLLPDHMLYKINLIRRGLSGHRPPEAMERLLFFQKKFPNNPQMLMEIKG